MAELLSPPIPYGQFLQPDLIAARRTFSPAKSGSPAGSRPEFRAPRPLADWLGKPCQFCGWLERWNGDKYLLREISIRLWNSPETRQIDHLWLTFEGDLRVERLSSYTGCGEIVEYRRGNGTWDYNVRTWAGLDFYRGIALAVAEFNCGKFRLAETHFALLLEKLTERRVCLNFGEDIEAHERGVRELLDRAKTQADINERYALNARANHRGKPTLDAKAKFASRRLGEAPGFGRAKA